MAVTNPTVAAALHDFVIARNMARSAYKAYNEAVQDLLPSEEERKARWETCRKVADQMQERVERIADEAVKAASGTPAYPTAVMDEVEVWNTTHP